MKRLFCVVDSHTNKIIPGLIEDKYFSSKVDAKKVRDEMNASLKEGSNPDAVRQYKVSLGPDHRRYNGKY